MASARLPVQINVKSSSIKRDDLTVHDFSLNIVSKNDTYQKGTFKIPEIN